MGPGCMAAPPGACQAPQGTSTARQRLPQAILRGSRFVRVLFLVVVSAIICKLAYDMMSGKR